MKVETVGGSGRGAARLSKRGAAAAGLLSLLVWAACAAAQARAQDAPTPHEPAPPPMKYLPNDIRQQLSTERDPKGRTRLSLELAEARLNRAAELTTAERYDAAGTELGVYQAIVEDAIRYLQSVSTEKNRHRDHSKRIEIALRSHVPRIETIRRTTPASYSVNVKAVIEFVRDARAEALNAFYDDTVLPESRRRKGTPDGGERAKEATQPTQERKPDQR